MVWGNNSANRWGRKKTRDRGPVTWIDKSGTKPAPFANNTPKYQLSPVIDDEIARYLEPGSLFYCVGNLGFYPESKNVDVKFKTLEPWYYAESAIVTAGQFIMYAGTIRIDERESNGRIVSALRHTFIFGQVRYIINDFSLIKPVI